MGEVETIDARDYMRPWKFTDSEGRLDLDFALQRSHTAHETCRHHERGASDVWTLFVARTRR
jgi:hypothetical protein